MSKLMRAISSFFSFSDSKKINLNHFARANLSYANFISEKTCESVFLMLGNPLSLMPPASLVSVRLVG